MIGSTGQLEGLRAGDWLMEINRWPGADFACVSQTLSDFFFFCRAKVRLRSRHQGGDSVNTDIGAPGNTWHVVPSVSLTTMSLKGVRASLVAQLVKNLPIPKEPLIRFLGREDLLEKG